MKVFFTKNQKVQPQIEVYWQDCEQGILILQHEYLDHCRRCRSLCEPAVLGIFTLNQSFKHYKYLVQNRVEFSLKHVLDNHKMKEEIFTRYPQHKRTHRGLCQQHPLQRNDCSGHPGCDFCFIPNHQR